jgi:hypothetical protein
MNNTITPHPSSIPTLYCPSSINPSKTSCSLDDEKYEFKEVKPFEVDDSVTTFGPSILFSAPRSGSPNQYNSVIELDGTRKEKQKRDSYLPLFESDFNASNFYDNSRNPTDRKCNPAVNNDNNLQTSRDKLFTKSVLPNRDS